MKAPPAGIIVLGAFALLAPRRCYQKATQPLEPHERLFLKVMLT
jgi:hypothetical protein